MRPPLRRRPVPPHGRRPEPGDGRAQPADPGDQVPCGRAAVRRSHQHGGRADWVGGFDGRAERAEEAAAWRGGGPAAGCSGMFLGRRVARRCPGLTQRAPHAAARPAARRRAGAVRHALHRWGARVLPGGGESAGGGWAGRDRPCQAIEQRPAWQPAAQRRARAEGVQAARAWPPGSPHRLTARPPGCRWRRSRWMTRRATAWAP
jgi:hypothetical protein